MADLSNWKQTYSDAADVTVSHPLITDVMTELRDNLGVSDTGLPAYGIEKVARYAAMVGRAQALGVDPDLLRMTSEEADSALLKRAAEASFLGVPVHLLNAGPRTPDPGAGA